MPISMPPTTNSYANQVMIVLSERPADPAAPTLAELNAGLFISCHTYGTVNVQPEQATGQGPRKSCTRVVPTELGSVTYPAFDVQYSYVPQGMGTPGAPGNEAVEELIEGTSKDVYIAEGLDGKTDALVEGDVVNHYYVDCGVQRRGYTGDGEFDKNAVTQSLVLKDGAEPDYDIVAPAA